MHISKTSPATTLQDEIAAASRLVEILRQEQTCLVNADINALSALTTEKANAVARMAMLANERYQALAAAGHAADETGMQQWAQHADTSAEARASWNALLGAARDAKELNRTNGLLINKHLGRNEDALNILRGNQAQGSTLYGPNGQATSRLGSRGLVIG